MNLKQVTKELTKKRDKEDLSDSNLEFEAYIDGIKDCFNLINKPVETTNEQSNLELEPEYFKDLNSILGSYYEMFEDDETKENELALVEVLQDRIDFLED